MSSHFARPPRRIVTGHDQGGHSVVLSDAPVQVTHELTEAGVGIHEVWLTEEFPVPLAEVAEEPAMAQLGIAPPATGSRVRINEMLPGSLDENGLQSPMHRTESIDFGIVIEGQVTLVLDGGEITAGPGDVIVQRGTIHAWANRGDTTARIAFVMLAGEFQDSLLEVTPSIRAGLS